MKNLWPSKFEPNTQRAPKAILEEQAGFLVKVTGGIVSAEVSPINQIDAFSYGLANDFVYRFDIVGSFIDNYKFTVLRISHDIALYPVKVLIDENIGSELQGTKSLLGFQRTSNSPDDFESLLEQVFQSERMKSIVGSIISLSK
jgi:hypothetical protein